MIKPEHVAVEFVFNTMNAPAMRHYDYPIAAAAELGGSVHERACDARFFGGRLPWSAGDCESTIKIATYGFPIFGRPPQRIRSLGSLRVDMFYFGPHRANSAVFVVSGARHLLFHRAVSGFVPCLAKITSRVLVLYVKLSKTSHFCSTIDEMLQQIRPEKGCDQCF
jgi:hypothetical protein